MPKTETVYARISLESYDRYIDLDEVRADINERLYEVLNDEFYATQLTKALEERYPEKIEPWTTYRNDPRAVNHPSRIAAVAIFNVTDQRVDFVDARFY